MDFVHDKEHKFLPLEQAAESKRKDLKKNCQMLERTVYYSNNDTDKLGNVRTSLDRNFVAAQSLLNDRKQELLAKLQDKIDGKINSMMDNVRLIFDQKTERVTTQINRKETFVNRLKASADMAHSLLKNGNDEEIVRSFQSVQENVDSANKEVHQDTYVDDNVLPWSAGEVDKLLHSEIEDFVKDKGTYSSGFKVFLKMSSLHLRQCYNLFDSSCRFNHLITSLLFMRIGNF